MELVCMSTARDETWSDVDQFWDGNEDLGKKINAQTLECGVRLPRVCSG